MLLLTLVIILISDFNYSKIVKQTFLECELGKCRPKKDREIGWIFDQPEDIYLDSMIQFEFEEGHRVHTR